MYQPVTCNLAYCISASSGLLLQLRCVAPSDTDGGHLKCVMSPLIPPTPIYGAEPSAKSKECQTLALTL